MAFLLLQESQIISGSQTMFLLKERLKSMGWQVLSSSDGSDNFGAHDILTSAIDLGTNSWFIIRDPNNKELAFQNGTVADHRDWQAWYSNDGTGFTSGAAATLTTFPSASDGVQWIGARGNEEADLFFPNATPQDHYTIIGGAEENYSFAYIGVSQSTRTEVRSGLWVDGIIKNSTSDTDDTVLGSRDYNANNYFDLVGNFLSIPPDADPGDSSVVAAWWRKNSEWGRFVGVEPWVPGNRFSTWDPIISGLSTSSFDGRLETLPLYWGRSSNRINCRFMKGESRIFLWNGTGSLAGDFKGPQTIGDQLTTTGGLNRIIWGIVNVPYKTELEVATEQDLPYLHWTFDELAFSKSWDRTSNKRDGFFSGNVSFSQAPVTNYGKSIAFNTSSAGRGFAFLTGADSFPATDFTIEFWRNALSGQVNTDEVIFQYNSGSDFENIIGIVFKSSSLHVDFTIYGETIALTSSEVLTGSKQYAFTWESTSGDLFFFLDGVEVDSGKLKIGEVLSSAGDFFVGNDSPEIQTPLSSAAIAAIDDFLIFSGVLSNSKIVSHYSASFGL